MCNRKIEFQNSLRDKCVGISSIILFQEVQLDTIFRSFFCSVLRILYLLQVHAFKYMDILLIFDETCSIWMNEWMDWEKRVSRGNLFLFILKLFKIQLKLFFLQYLWVSAFDGHLFFIVKLGRKLNKKELIKRNLWEKFFWKNK